MTLCTFLGRYLVKMGAWATRASFVCTHLIWYVTATKIYVIELELELFPSITITFDDIFRTVTKYLTTTEFGRSFVNYIEL